MVTLIMKKKSPSILFLSLIFLLVGCNEKETIAKPETEVSILKVEAKPVILRQMLTGRTSASLISEVRPQVNGQIIERRFEEGSEVEKGQVLYKIDSATYQAAYDQAKATLDSAKASLETAKNKNDRYQALRKSKGVSQQDLDDVVADYKAALATVAQAQASLDSASINLDRTEIKAQISGYISISNVTVGALVTASQTDALATIRALDPIYVDVTQSSTQLLRLRKLLSQKNIKSGSTSVELQLEDGSIYSELGTLQLQEVSVDESTGSVTLRAKFPNPNKTLLPGMFVRAIVDDAVDEQAIVVPQRVVTRNAKGEPTVLIVTSENKVEQKTIKVGKAIKDQWLVISGLIPGEQLIVEGINKVAVGDSVKTINYEDQSKTVTVESETDDTTNNTNSINNK